MGEGEIPPPGVLALVICDAIWRDPWSGKFTIIGTYDSIKAKVFPVHHPIISVYSALTNGRGKVPLKVRIVDVDEEREPVAELEQEIEFPDPRSKVQHCAVFANPLFPAPGEYRVQLWSSSVCLLEQRLLVHQVQEGTPNAPQE